MNGMLDQQDALHRKHPKRLNVKPRELAEAPCAGSTCTPALAWLGAESMGLVFSNHGKTLHGAAKSGDDLSLKHCTISFIFLFFFFKRLGKALKG